MRAIILAAGTGSRLRPLTENTPKSLIQLHGRELLDYQLQAFDECGINDVTVVTGYRAEAFDIRGVRCRNNPEYETTNLVHSLACAEDLFDDEVIVSYGNIVYEPRILRALLRTTDDIAVCVDRAWRDLWNYRKNDRLSKAEHLQLNRNGTIREIGGTPPSTQAIEGRYIGLLRFSQAGIKKMLSHYHALDQRGTYEGRSHRQMDLPALINMLAKDEPVRAVPVAHGWLELETSEDLRRYEKLRSAGEALFDFSVFDQASSVEARDRRAYRATPAFVR
jgi:choline kinase